MRDRKYRKLELDSAFEYSRSLASKSFADSLMEMGAKIPDAAKPEINRCFDVFQRKCMDGALARQWGEISEDACKRHDGKCWRQYMQKMDEISAKYGIVMPGAPSV